MPDIKTSSVVVLLSGSPDMTVIGTPNDKIAEVNWFVAGGELKSAWFPISCLKLKSLDVTDKAV